MNIQPVSTFFNGNTVSITQLIVVLVWDNLADQATFYFKFLTANDVQVSDGNLTMTGQDYADWNTTNDINLAAYQWCAAELNVTFV